MLWERREKLTKNQEMELGMFQQTIGLSFLILAGGLTPSSAQTAPVSQGNWVKVDFTATPSGHELGLIILAKNIRDATASMEAVGRTREGVGAAGAQASAPAIKAETGFDPVRRQSEQIIILFDAPVSETSVDVAYFFRDEGKWDGVRYHEQGGWRAYRKDVLIDEGRFLPEITGGEHQIIIKAKAVFDRLEMFATPYVTESGMEIEPGVITSDSSDFLIKQISYKPAGDDQADPELQD
jgi:hypothetical protein